MIYAEIKKDIDAWDANITFLFLRAFHYLSEFEHVQEIHLNSPEPPEDIRKIWKASLDLRKCGLNIQFGCPLPDVPVFMAPDFSMRINGKQIINLGIPDIPDLTDFHLHTFLAYCSENMEIAKAVELEHLSGVKYMNFAEHSGQLYCTPEVYWSNRFIWNQRDPAACRTQSYLLLAKENAGPDHTFGLELDVDRDSIVSDVPGLSGFRIGAIHFLGNDLTYEEKKQDFMRRLEGLLSSGIDILAHPFRVFLKSGMPIPEDLFDPVAEKLVHAHVAAEINFHTNHPQPEFVDLVLKKRGKLSFGTDSHNLYEAGYLKPHYEFCRQLGIAGKLDEVLLSAAAKHGMQNI